MVSNSRGDGFDDRNDTVGVTEESTPDWHLQEWMTHFEKKQASLVNELGWHKGRANFVWHGKQQYSRALVNEISDWLGIEPFELLMPPEDAFRYRRIRETAIAMAAEEARAASAAKRSRKN